MCFVRVPGSATDFYYYSPWRAPGSAPVIDPCGSAGGRLPGQPGGNFGATYTDTPNAKTGSFGSQLKPAPSSVRWTAGKTYEVAWALQANHGGGYSYRLCKRDAQHGLTEACFQQTPLVFVGSNQTFRWGGVDGYRHSFQGTYVTEGTTPPGSMCKPGS